MTRQDRCLYLLITYDRSYSSSLLPLPSFHHFVHLLLQTYTHRYRGHRFSQLHTDYAWWRSISKVKVRQKHRQLYFSPSAFATPSRKKNHTLCRSTKINTRDEKSDGRPREIETARGIFRCWFSEFSFSDHNVVGVEKPPSTLVCNVFTNLRSLTRGKERYHSSQTRESQRQRKRHKVCL